MPPSLIPAAVVICLVEIAITGNDGSATIVGLDRGADRGADRDRRWR